MRAVLIAILACLALATTAEAQAPDFTVKAEPDAPLFADRPSGRTLQPNYIPPLAINEGATGPVRLRIQPYRETWSELYEPEGYRDDRIQVGIEYQPEPLGPLARLTLRGLKQMYEAQRPDSGPAPGVRPMMLPSPKEYSGSITLSFPLGGSRK